MSLSEGDLEGLITAAGRAYGKLFLESFPNSQRLNLDEVEGFLEVSAYSGTAKPQLMATDSGIQVYHKNGLSQPEELAGIRGAVEVFTLSLGGRFGQGLYDMGLLNRILKDPMMAIIVELMLSEVRVKLKNLPEQHEGFQNLELAIRFRDSFILSSRGGIRDRRLQQRLKGPTNKSWKDSIIETLVNEGFTPENNFFKKGKVIAKIRLTGVAISTTMAGAKADYSAFVYRNPEHSLKSRVLREIKIATLHAFRP